MFSLHHATLARQVIFLPATVNLFWDSQLAGILPNTLLSLTTSNTSCHEFMVA
jgi:hypothetical protein